MKKLYILLSGVMMFGVFATVTARQNTFEWKDGAVKVRNVEDVDSITFSAEGLYKATCSEASNVTKTSFSGTATVAFADGVKNLSGATPTIGICFSYKKTKPTISDETRYLGEELKTYDFNIDGLVSGATYYYRPYVIVSSDVYYGAVQSVDLVTEELVDDSQYVNGHWFVDLELPSGLLWADTNIGAATAADDGEYFAWGETATKSDFSWETYAFGASIEAFTKYTTTDKLTTLEATDDAATANWGEGCRIPTHDDYKELMYTGNCSWKWTSKTASDGTTIEGYTVTSKRNGNSIFLPASGGRYGTDANSHGTYGFYWTSSISQSAEGNSYALNFATNNYYYRSSYDRYFGFAVRPVAEQK